MKRWGRWRSVPRPRRRDRPSTAAGRTSGTPARVVSRDNSCRFVLLRGPPTARDTRFRTLTKAVPRGLDDLLPRVAGPPDARGPLCWAVAAGGSGVDAAGGDARPRSRVGRPWITRQRGPLQEDETAGDRVSGGAAPLTRPGTDRVAGRPRSLWPRGGRGRSQRRHGPPRTSRP